MKARDLKTIVDRTTRDIAARLADMRRAVDDKKPTQINDPERMMLRTVKLAESVLRPSKSEQERIIGTNDLVDMNYFERGLLAARSVCRVILRNEAGRQIGVASGFMVSPRLMLTNHHVFPTDGDARLALAQFDYVLDINGIERRGPSFRVRPDLYYYAEQALDFALVAVDSQAEGGSDGATLESFRYLRLDPGLGKINQGEFISIVQHPSGLPKQVAMRENQLLRIETDFLVYRSDTAQGSSGSPLFNDTWQVVGLHSAGVPNKNSKGQWLTRTGAVADDDTEDGDIDWVGNRGARASRIVAAWHRAPAGPLRDELLAITAGENKPEPGPDPLPEIFDQRAPSRISALRVYAVAGGARIDLPLGFSADVEPAGGRTSAAKTAAAPAPLPAAGAVAVEAYKAPVVDTKYANRKGYETKFLSKAIALPGVTKKSLAAPMDNGEIAIPYEHFSIVMHKQRRLALFTACNVDARETARRPDPTKAYTRAALGGLSKNDVEMWVHEPRIADEHQLPDAFFKNDRKSFDKGHVVRRDDVVWGKSYAQVRRANGDSFHVTNCSPQVAAFNQSSKGGDWGLLENMILRQAKGEKVVIFAGPVLDDAKDKPFKGEDENGGELIVQIPSRYWKIVVADGEDGLEAYGFVLKQDLKSVVWEFDVEADWVEELKPLADIQKAAGLVKFPKVVMDADMFGRIEVAESLRSQEIQRRR
ncbi:MAG: DNA/RNA non-specific endonuclease [Alphaproteobacteria bacterium]|nr:DNA/RNA non-specific endonuclease [Alphaproteobacteria bacterium]MCW5744048.1 DNA/RNA non-specific endonuclease [Alphaproteobacteria bacterium]